MQLAARVRSNVSLRMPYPRMQGNFQETVDVNSKLLLSSREENISKDDILEPIFYIITSISVESRCACVYIVHTFRMHNEKYVKKKNIIRSEHIVTRESYVSCKSNTIVYHLYNYIQLFALMNRKIKVIAT